MTKEIKVFVSLGDTHVSITNDKHQNNGQVTVANGILNQDELAMVGIISSLVRQLTIGNPLCYVFKPEEEIEVHRLVMCEWMINGGLRIKPGTATRKYQHAETQEEALKRERSFTCEYSLAIMLPKKREKKVTP